MAVKETYDTEVKKRSRRREKKFIKYTFSTRDNLRVLFLPGPEAAEIHEVFDPLGIRHQNLYGLEGVPEVQAAVAAKANELGFNFIAQTFHDFVHGPVQQFDILSLDFQGQLGTYYEDIMVLFQRGFVSLKAILITNFSGRREDGITRALYMMQTLYQVAKRDGEEKNSFLFDPRQYQDTKGLHIEKVVKSFGVRYLEHRYFSILNKQFNLALADWDYVSFIAAYELQQEGVDPEIAKCEEHVRLLNEMCKRMGFCPTPGGEELQKIARDNIACMLIEYFAARGIKDIPSEEHMLHKAQEIMYFVRFVLEPSYLIKDHRGYKYVGDNGFPMFIDMVSLDYGDRQRNVLQRFFNSGGSTLAEVMVPLWNLNFDDFADFNKVILVMGPELSAGLEYKSSPREDLGTESAVIEERVRGMSEEKHKKFVYKTLEKHPDMDSTKLGKKVRLSAKQIGGYKATLTKRRAKSNGHPISISKTNKLKKKAYKLLEQGKSVQEVMDCTGYSLGQVSAFKAWITMRKSNARLL